MYSEPETAVGTSAYIVGRTDAERLLDAHRLSGGFTDAIPTQIAKLFPESRFAVYPMVFHRAGKVGSLVNQKQDDFQ